MRIIWGTSSGFPGPMPISRFKTYIKYHQREVHGSYFAYGDASVRDLSFATEALAKYRSFLAETPAGESAEAFEQRYRDFEREVAPLLGGGG